MHLEVDKADLHHIRAVNHSAQPLDAGEARIRVDTFGLSANNITYAVYGETMRYWECFPAPNEDGVSWGRVPVWGFGDVVESNAPDLAVGRRVYSRYGYVESDRIYRREREPQHMLLWPLFVTSFVVDDFLGDHDLYGAGTAVVSSASSKTAIGSAFLLAERPGIEVIGLTSSSNLEFVRSLSCYDTVLTYEEIAALPEVGTCYLDVAGRRDITHAVHSHLGDHLLYSMVIGDTHWDNAAAGDGDLPGPRPEFLFAPVQIAKRRTDWGRDGFETNVAAAWDRFVPWTDGWLTLRSATGPVEVEAVFRSLLDGRVNPRIGDICTLSKTPGVDR